MKKRFPAMLMFVLLGTLPGAWAGPLPQALLTDASSWPEAMMSLSGHMSESGEDTAKLTDEALAELWKRYPVQTSWLVEDLRTPDQLENPAPSALRRLLDPPTRAATLRTLTGREGDLLRLLSDYEADRRQRRRQRLDRLAAVAPRLVYVERKLVEPSFFAYTEGQSDAQAEAHFLPGSRLCLLHVEPGREPRREVLLDAPDGVVRDPEISWDGQRILFAYKKNREDDYHLYEMLAADRGIRQITTGQGVADYEGCYLPNGDLLFTSSRCVQTVDCWWTEVSNLYTCDPDGRFLRRLGFDQVHTVHPSVLDDGRVVYTRWDYNDRGQVFPQPLFQMNPDGTGQTEFYGNNSWFPTTTSHARGLPGSGRVVAVLMGHHTWQAGKLAVIDPSKGTQENAGVQLIAPERQTKAVRVDGYGQDGELFRHPYPLSQQDFLVAYCPDRQARKRKTPFHLCWVDRQGRREVLHGEPVLSCNSPVPLLARQAPPNRPARVDYTEQTGQVYLQDIYTGPGLAGIERGTVDTLRVVALDFRAAGVGNNRSRGEAGAALISTPISVGNGCWDVKTILGETEVEPDGSAFFKVPARTPLYFQAVDRQGQVVQTMRSWTTLMPGETQSCTGCHEDKQNTPLPSQVTQAGRRGPRPLRPFLDHEPTGFSFVRHVQPILDRHCVSCHDGNPEGVEDKAFSLKSTPYPDPQAQRNWSEAYLNLTGAQAKPGAQGQPERDVLNWISSQSRPTPLPPYHRGSGTSTLLTQLREGHGDTSLSEDELACLAAWIDLGVPYCGNYLEANAWNEQGRAKYQRYQAKRDRLAEEERVAIAEYLKHRR